MQKNDFSIVLKALKAEWSLIVLSKSDIKQIIIMCCKVMKMLQKCDVC
jgi:hypothetical protein